MTRGASAIRGRGRRTFCPASVVLLWIISFAATAFAPARAAEPDPPARIVSINACADQLLFALADRGQIAALTNYSVDDGYSIYADEVRASGIQLIRGNAEEVLKLTPDLVLAGTYTRRATRQLLQRHGVRLELFPPAGNVEEAKEAIRRVAALIGGKARGEELIARIDQALAAAPDLRARGLTVLQIQRRGFVSGPETLVGDLLWRLGVANAAPHLGVDGIGRASLEAALKVQADGLLLFDPAGRVTDQGAALLLHPALAELYPSERRVSLPGRLVLCAGPALPMAIAELTRSIGQLSPRSRRP
jgi:iron complex transport system substrate-binding protein